MGKLLMGCFLVVFFLFNLFFGWIFFGPKIWLLSNAIFILISIFTSRFAFRYIRLKPGVRSKDIIDIQGKVVEDKNSSSHP